MILEENWKTEQEENKIQWNRMSEVLNNVGPSVKTPNDWMRVRFKL